MTTPTGFVMTLANSIIGVSLLAMPFCFKQCGVLLGILLLLASNTLTRLSCYFLVKSAVMGRGRCFEHVAVHAFGRPGKVFVELGVIGFMMGTSVAFFVVMGDLAPSIASKMFLVENNDNLRSFLLVVIGVFVILPLSLLRNIESLAAISTITMLFYFLLVFKVLTESFTHLAAADWPPYLQYWRPEGILQCFPIFAMALSCQTQVFEILEVLPNPTLDKMNGVVRSAVGLCTVLYVAVGFLGYVAYAREPFSGNVLLSFSQSTNSDLFQLGFVLSIAVSFPIVVFPCRASLNSLLFKKAAQYQDLPQQTTFIPEFRFKWLTFCIISVALFTALLIPSIEFVLGFVGSTIGVATCVLFPSYAFVKISNKQTAERLVAKIMVVLAVVLMILGTYANLDALSERSLVVPTIEEPNKLLPNLAAPSLDKPSVDKQFNNDKLRKNIEQPVKESLHIDPEKRIEPPIPEAPNIEEPKKENPLIRVDAFKELNAIPAQKPDVPKAVEDVKVQPMGHVSPPDVVVLPKKIDSIHQDAIAKEEHELKENDNQQKNEVLKQEELLKKLAEHQEEQKKLLEEQRNILDEIKSRDTEAKPIRPAKFVDSLDKIQEVIDDLKERKEAIDKEKGVKIAEDKKKTAEKKLNLVKLTALAVSEEPIKEILPVKPVESTDLKDVKLPSLLLQKVNKSIEVVPIARDILEEKTQPREKRDADESCPKEEKTVIQKEVKVTNSPQDDKDIKSTEKISNEADALLLMNQLGDKQDTIVRLVEQKNSIEREMK